MGDHHQDHAADADDVEGGDAEKRVTHVHNRAVTDHLFQIALGDGDETDVEHVAADREQGQPTGPVSDAQGQQGRGDLHQAVETELLQHTGMEHGGGAGRGTVAKRRPSVEGEERNEDTEAKEQEAEDYVLIGAVDRGVRDHLTQHDEIEVFRPALIVERDQADQRKHGTKR